MEEVEAEEVEEGDTKDTIKHCQEDGLTVLNRVQAVGGGCVHTCQSSLAVSFIPEVQIRIGTEGGLVHTSYFW